MTAQVAQPVIEKQAFRNDSPGWIGVTVIGPEGRPKGKGVEPGDIVWLSEQEQILTANAPRRAEDNPFVEQTLYFGVNGEGVPVERTVTPLTPVTENRYVPAGSRPIPAQGMIAQPTAEEIGAQEQPAPATTPEAPAPTTPAPTPAPTPSPTPAPASPTPPAAPPVPPRAAAAVAAADAQPPVEEETAAATPPPVEHQETGQAVAPSQDAAEGEYAAHEEVGTPGAPAAAPVPYTPPEGG